MSTKLGTLTLNLIAQIGSFTEPMKKAGDTAQRETKRIESSVSSASKAIAGLGAAALAGLTVGSVINMADEYTQMAARIRNATADTAEYDMVQKRLLETANGTYRSLSEAQEVYLSLAGGMKSLGKTTEETLNVADSLSYAFVANAARADQAQSAMDALNKSMAKGKIDADAWISIVSAADNIIADMAKVTGKAEAEIRQLGATGKIALSDLLTTLEVTKDANQALADNMENSLADGLQKVRNSFSAFVGEINVTYGVTSKMAGALSILADNLNVVAIAGAVVAVAMGSRMVVEFGKTNAAMLANTIATRNKVLADYERAKADLAATAAMVQSMGPLNAQTAAMVANARAAYQKAAAAKEAAVATLTLANAGRSALAFFGGPVGLALTVATVASGYLMLSQNSDESTKSLRANNESVSDAIIAYQQLNQVQKAGQMVEERNKLAELQKAYDTANNALKNYSLGLSSHNEIVTQSDIELQNLAKQYNSGKMTLEQFTSSVQQSSRISQEAKDKVALMARAVNDAGSAAKEQKGFIDLLNGSLNNTEIAGDNAARGLRNAAEAVAEYTGKLKQQKWDLEYVNTLVQKYGKSREEAELMLQTRKENSKKGVEGITAEQKSLIADITRQRKAAEVYAKAQSAAASAQKKASSESTKAAKQQAKVAERTAEEIAQIRESISYSYANKEKQIEQDLQKELAEIRKAGMGSYYEDRAKAKADAEKALYKAQLEYEINEYKMTEEAKLRARLDINQKMLVVDQQLSAKDLEARAIALNEQYKQEREMLRINQQMQLLEAKRHWMTAGDYAREYYALVREEILNTASYSPEMKEALLQQAVSQQNFEQSGERDQAISDYRDVMGYEESPLVKQFEVLDKMRELDLISEEKYQQDKLMLQTKYSASYMESMLGGFAALVDENSSLYAGLFAAQKAFAVAQAMLNIPSAYSKAYDAVVGTPYVGPYIAPAIGAAAAALQVAQAASIKSVGLTGMAHDGINNIPEEGTWLLNKGERVLNPSQNRDLTNYLSQVQTGGQNRPIDNKLSVIMVKDEDEAKNYKYSKDFEDAVLYHMKRNRSKI